LFLTCAHFFFFAIQFNQGAINFVAVSETLNVSGSSISAAIAADNVVIALYFGMLFSLAKAADESDSDSDNEKLEIDVRDPEDVNAVGSDMTMPSIATSITVASCLVIAGKLLTTALLPTMSVSTNKYSLLQMHK
jgi:uncharacterized membrane protein